MAAVADDVDGFDDVGVPESRTDTKLGSDLLLVLLLALARSFGPKLLDGEDVTILFSLYKADGAARTRSKDTAPFAILLCEMCLCGLGERGDRVNDRDGNLATCGEGRGM